MNLKIIFLIISIALLLVSCAPEEAAEITITSIEDTSEGIVEETTTETAETTEEVEEETEEPEPEETTTTNYELVEIEDLKFKPDEMTITTGTMVKWVHNDLYSDSSSIKHIIRIYKKGEIFNAQSSPMFFGDSYNYTFTEPGEYYYISIVYAERGVRGDITVG